MEDKADTSAAREFKAGKIIGVAVDDGPELGAEFSDDVQDQVCLPTLAIAQRITQLEKLLLVF
jgi:hypothetical protein